MKRLFHIVTCAILLTACCSGVGFSQMIPPDSEMQRQFYEELQITQADMDAFGQSIQPLREEMGQNFLTKATEIPKHEMEAYMHMTPEENMRHTMKRSTEITLDEMMAMQPRFREKSNEFFTAERNQKMQLRLFQMKEGIMERLDSTDNPEVLQGAFSVGMMQLTGGYPDFLDLSPEQKDLLLAQQKKTSLESMMLVSELTIRNMSDPAKREQMRRLVEEMQKAKTDEQRAEISKKTQELNGDAMDVMKEIAPQLKKILKDDHENFLRTLTDAQRAKIKTVMAEMPDYMKKGFEKFDKDGTGFGNLDSWVPGSGVPGVSNPNREAPRQREGGREFPN